MPVYTQEAKGSQRFSNPTYAELTGKEAEAYKIIKNFFESRYNGSAQTIMASLPLTGIVEAIDMVDAITCRDISSKTTIYIPPSTNTLLALKEKSKRPPIYELIIYDIYARRLIKAGSYYFEGKNQLEVLALVAKQEQSIEESIRKTKKS